MAQAGKPQRSLNIADWLLDRHVREGRGDRIAVAGVGETVTYAELAGRVNRFGSALRELGVGSGDRVLLVLPDSSTFIVCFLGAAKIGAVAVPVNPLARREDYVHYAADCGTRLAVVHAESKDRVRLALDEIKSPPRVLTAGGDCSESETYEHWLGRGDPQCEIHPAAGDDLAFLLYTSGSGGLPKAAMHTHHDVMAAAENYGGQVLGIGPGDVTFSVSKLFFAYGLGNGLYFPLSVGATTVLLPDRPAPDSIFSVLREFRPSLFFSVPTVYGALLQATQDGAQQLDSVRLAVSAGEALPAEIFTRFRERFGQEILDGIGSTEMLHIFLSSRPGEARPGSCGKPVPGYEARIVDEDDAETPQGEIGNLWVRGESAFTGYWNQPDLTARTRNGEWVITGDKFYRDAEGYYHYCGRSDDMLKVSGLWVSPMEVENALLAHDEVREAAVAGRSNTHGLTEIAAFVVLRAGSAGSDDLADRLRKFVRERLPGYKCPQHIEFASELPKTATGKIQRFKLRS